MAVFYLIYLVFWQIFLFSRVQRNCRGNVAKRISVLCVKEYACMKVCHLRINPPPSFPWQTVVRQTKDAGWTVFIRTLPATCRIPFSISILFIMQCNVFWHRHVEPEAQSYIFVKLYGIIIKLSFLLICLCSFRQCTDRFWLYSCKNTFLGGGTVQIYEIAVLAPTDNYTLHSSQQGVENG